MPLAKDEPQDSEIARRRAAVMRIVDRLVEDSKDLSARLQDPRSAYPTPGYDKVNSLVGVLTSLRPVIHHRLYFSPTLQYLYASQLARRAGSDGASGENVEAVESQLAEAQRQRESELSCRETVLANLSDTLRQLDAQGSQAVRKCRQGLEADMQRVIRRYDRTMSCLQTELDSLRDQHRDLTAKLETETAHLSVVEARYRAILEEKQRQEEERLAAMQAEFRREHAARTIQRAWQHYKMRKMLKKAQRKRKKKPKDGK
ncbi:uncharacterized protein LOC126982074 isoform X2 [Eriocheir sinensis]|uniref:uncharacterized protein LOC126982074 isoform X2 n=1 Tax=Eriocheir sinensis TaxID=95602 RepID=UPI0021C93657|nr:uncharacterized protein LOC126982074 isoform X2 [Eriocheir sinensis]